MHAAGANKRIEFVRCAHPTRNGEPPLLVLMRGVRLSTEFVTVLRVAAITVALLPPVASSASSAAPEWASPALITHTLTDQKFSIPAHLPERASLLIIGFTKASTVQTSAWSRELARDSSLKSLIATYQVAVIEDVPALMRRFVIRGIRNGVPETLHDRFLIATDRSEDWKALTSYSKPDIAYLVLMDKQHKIRWRNTGEASAASLQALRIAAAELHEGPRARLTNPCSRRARTHAADGCR
jgi:hypothetical protein